MSLLRLTLRQPAQIGDRVRNDAVLTTLRHIPGAVIRGALAAAWISRHGAPEPGTRGRAQFLELFEGGVRYGPLFAGEPVPSLAVLTHKYPPTPECDHVDLDEVEHPDPPGQCAQCDSPWKQETSLRRDDSIVVRRRTSVVMTSAGVAQRGGLFFRDRLAERRDDGTPLALEGHLVTDDPSAAEALAALERVRIGGRRTTHGLAEVTIDLDTAPPPPERTPDGQIVLRLRSPAVFVDEQGRPTAEPKSHHLEPFLGTGAEVTRSWYRWVHIGGWHAASGLPKPTEVAVAAGSTYLVRPAGPVSDDALRELAAKGLGLRRHEGFGDIGPTATVRPGRVGLEAERGRVRAVAAVRGLSTRPQAWQRIVELLAAHADGDATAGTQLTQLADKFPDAVVRAAMRRLLTYTPDDTRAVLQEWS